MKKIALLKLSILIVTLGYGKSAFSQFATPSINCISLTKLNELFYIFNPYFVEGDCMVLTIYGKLFRMLELSFIIIVFLLIISSLLSFIRKLNNENWEIKKNILPKLISILAIFLAINTLAILILFMLLSLGVINFIL